MSWPQPREGITGSDRRDDLLSLEDAAIPRRLVMAGMAKALLNATMVGQPAPIVKRMYARMRDPQPGDLVIELSTMWSRDEDTRIKGMGILVAHRQEWASTDAEWSEYVAEEKRAYDEDFKTGPYYRPEDGEFDADEMCERITDHAWYIQYGPAAADICRWTNCEFVAVISADMHLPTGRREGGAVVIGRSDLVDALADSGFNLRPGVAGGEPR